jgi:hypothetical protein
MKKLENVDHSLPHVNNWQTRERKKELRKKREGHAFIHGYSTHHKSCDGAQIVLNPLVVIIEAIN